MKILVCGFSGAGKSTWVNFLINRDSENLNFKAYDLDHEVAKMAGVGPEFLGAFIARVGEEKFRAMETEALNLLLSNNESALIALGGGSLNETLMTKIRQSQAKIKLVFLDEEFQICSERIEKDPNRLLNKLSKDELESLYLRRLILYRQADLILKPKEIKLIDGLGSLVHTLSKH